MEHVYATLNKLASSYGRSIYKICHRYLKKIIIRGNIQVKLRLNTV